jgi:hypothetical protein
VVINPTVIDAYIAKKGLAPRVGEVEWEAILKRVATSFGRELWHRCRLIHQTDDEFRRHSSVFPDAVPQPYRYIHHLELVAFESPKLRELQRWLTDRGVVWRERLQFDADTQQEQVVGLQIFGYDPDAGSPEAAR